LRWPTGFTLAPFNALLVWAVVSPVALAAAAADRGLGLLNAASLPPGLGVVASVLVLDLLAYLQHRLLHAAPVLWSFHRVHHADIELDCTTALRFHPVEALVTSVILLAGVVVFGLPPAGVAAYRMLATAMTLFEHGNVRLPATLDSRLRGILVTPEMHRIHHSTAVEDHDTNFATVFPMWDRCFRTYRRRAAGGDADPDVGLPGFRDPKYATLPWTLALPFLAAGGERRIRRRASQG
jgi:sterol desaturase/sphingolipid hydroxylase (fatty acid hydroxylase superfamily)